MANLRGKGAFTNQHLLVTIPPNRIYKDKETGEVKGRFIDVQVDQSMRSVKDIQSGKQVADSNPHLYSATQKHPNGGEFTTHYAYYTQEQVDKMVAGANAVEDGKKSRDMTLDDGTRVLAINADLVQNTKDGQKGVFVNTAKPITPNTDMPDNRFTPTILDRQNQRTAAAKDARAARIEADKQARAAEATAEAAAPEAAVEAPEEDVAFDA